MTIETTTARTRRAVLAGGVGAVAAVAVNALARPERALAADPNDVVLGATNTATLTTEVINTTNPLTVFRAQSTNGGIGLRGNSVSNTGVEGGSTSGSGVTGASSTGSGVRGTSSQGIALDGESVNNVAVRGFGGGGGVSGTSPNFVGVQGNSTTYYGMVGFTDASDKAGIAGYSLGNGTGIQGSSGGAVIGKAKTGVYGAATQDSGSRGVWGTSTAGRGVFGEATSGLGVRGFASTGVGLSGEATTGYALRTKGRVRLDQSAGQATIASGTSSVIVTPGVDLTSTSAVVATLNGNAGGSTAVKRVAISTSANTFTIYLTANATATVKAAWIILG